MRAAASFVAGFAVLAALALALAACKSDGSGGVIDAATSGDSGAVKTAAGDAAKDEAKSQAQAQVQDQIAQAGQAGQAAEQAGQAAGQAGQVAQAGQAQQAAAQPTGTLTKIAPSANYPVKTCIVSGEPLPAAPFAYSWQGREVQFCCPGCTSDFLKDPATYLAKLDAAR